MRSVVAATEDLFLFILSEKGSRVRMHLTRDVLKAIDAFLKEAVGAQNSSEDSTSEVNIENRLILPFT